MVINMAYDLDIHGKTKEEALKMVQRHIEMLYQKGIMEFNLIHGFRINQRESSDIQLPR